MQLIYLEKIIHLRHTLHQHPDLSMRESGTIRFLQNFLRENTSLEIHEREGWFYALKKSSSPDKFRAGNKESGKPATTGSIAFRADLDALPMMPARQTGIYICFFSRARKSAPGRNGARS